MLFAGVEEFTIFDFAGDGIELPMSPLGLDPNVLP
jgi:hypothetical protein